jgi:ATP-dependent Lon protease
MFNILKQRDILDIKTEYIEGMEFHFVNNMFEVLDLALTNQKVKHPIDFTLKNPK